LHWTLELLAADGVTEVMINLHHLPRTVRAAVGDGRAFGGKVSYSFEPEILGTGGGPRKVRRWIGDEPILLLNGDVVFDFDLTALRRPPDRAGAPGRAPPTPARARGPPSPLFPPRTRAVTAPGSRRPTAASAPWPACRAPRGAR